MNADAMNADPASTLAPFLTTGTGVGVTDVVLDALRTRDRPLVRVVRGSRMRTRTALFDEVSAALQFPIHFGDNWDALADCLGDLGWLGGPALVVLAIAEADRVGADATDVLPTFASVLAGSGLQVLLHQPDGAAPDPAWGAAGLQVTDLR